MSLHDGKTCPYCNQPTEYIDSSLVYGKSYGMIYICQPCKAWVGVHKGTNQALGRLADAELRKCKCIAHYYFDGLWKKKMKQGFSKSSARRKAYRWLAGKMGLSVKETHIGMFGVKQCKQVIEICKSLYHEPTR
jgi:hypothetical protein